MKTKKQFNYYTLSIFSILILYCGIAQAVQWKMSCRRVEPMTPKPEMTVITGNTIRSTDDIKKVEFSANNNSPSKIVRMELTVPRQSYNPHNEYPEYKYDQLATIIGKMKDIPDTHWEIERINDHNVNKYADKPEYIDVRLNLWGVQYFHFDNTTTPAKKVFNKNIGGIYQCEWVECSSCGIS
ncbi:MAG: hypothetical protein K0R14_459 [Burkholderiales bacterium]|jgi:hypothetical protein|nr:hypothetical protein [Burkholderiales bacterium]